jgi:RNA ligase (TIGR02306 family)
MKICPEDPGVYLEVAGSKGMRRKRPSDENIGNNLYWSPFTLESVKSLLYDVSNMYLSEIKQIILFGEIYGPSVQSLHYGMSKSKPGYRAFDLLIDGKYADYDEFIRLCEKHGVPTVPLVYRGPFDINKIKELSNGNTLMGVENHIREGVVVKPVHERTDPKVGRVILKYVSDTYLFGSNSDFKEE